MQELKGKTAVVTGAGSGMGRAFAERFADAGMNVVLADIEEPRLDDALASVTGAWCGGDRRGHRRVRRRRRRSAARHRTRALRPGQRRVQQRRGRRLHRRRHEPRQLAVGDQREHVGRDPRPSLVPPAPAGARRRPHRQHRVDGRALPRSQRLLGEQVGRRRAHRRPVPPAARRGLDGRRVVPVPGLGQHRHRQRRPQPAGVGRATSARRRRCRRAHDDGSGVGAWIN